jgi:hypothetical protein
MKLMRFLPVLICAAICSACASGFVKVTDESNRTIGWKVSSVVDGRTLIARLDPMEVEKTPDWDPNGPAPPPLTAGEASHRAWVEARIYLTSPEEWQPTAIKMFRLMGSKWAYMVTWEPIDGDSNDILNIPILFSGHPVTLDEPKVASEADEENQGEGAY